MIYLLMRSFHCFPLAGLTFSIASKDSGTIIAESRTPTSEISASSDIYSPPV